ncbi:unnamed protein product [Staurois parvus]|uniref:Uncharacterized protein n=1 Tax=Staurois parvus TaxID=386267 RepID=A0ABN9HCT6_9NEOB|nr:unnamed protein product [Staurois parvus]
MGPRTASSCCCQARNLPWPSRTLLNAGMPGSTSVQWVPVLIDAVLHRHTLPCATLSGSPHTAVGFHFCHRVLARFTGLPLLLPRNLSMGPL